MFPHKIFKRALKRSFPKVHGKPKFCGAQRYITDFEGFDGSPDDPYFVYVFRVGATEITLEFRSSLSWISIDLHGTDKGYATLWEGSAK